MRSLGSGEGKGRRQKFLIMDPTLLWVKDAPQTFTSKNIRSLECDGAFSRSLSDCSKKAKSFRNLLELGQSQSKQGLGPLPFFFKLLE